MVFRLLGIVALLALLALNTSSASAKQPSFILTGGELGAHAAVVYAPWPEGRYLPFGAPVSQLVATHSPEPAPSLRYDIYGAGPYTSGYGPSYHYYPAERLLYRVEFTQWYEVLPDWAVFMELAIEGALNDMARGELEVGRIAAGLRQMRIPEGSIWLRPYGGAEWSEPVPSQSSPGWCGSCIPLRGSVEQFVMRDLAATLNRTPIPNGSQGEPAFSMEFFTSMGVGGVGGLAGFYALPEDGEPGRFWSPAYELNPVGPYYEATEGFDIAIANALVGWVARDNREAAEPDRISVKGKGSHKTASIGVGAAMAVAGLCVGGAIFYRRRTTK